MTDQKQGEKKQQKRKEKKIATACSQAKTKGQDFLLLMAVR